MRTSRASLMLAGALGLGGAAGFLLSHTFREPVLRRALERERELERITESLRKELDRLSGELESRDDLLKKSAALLEQERARHASPVEGAVVSSEAESPNSPAREVRGIALGSIDEAEAIFDKALQRSDALALIELGEALLAMGDPGYEKLIVLFDRLEGAGSPLWEDRLYMGPLARAIVDHHEDLLRLGLYLHEKEPESLSSEAKKVKQLLSEDEVSTLLLGLYQGGDPRIDTGYVEMYKQELEAEPTTRAIRGLAQIPGDEAAEALIASSRTAPPTILKELVIALAYRKDKRALSALEALRAGLTGEEQAGLDALIDSAVRALR